MHKVSLLIASVLLSSLIFTAGFIFGNTVDIGWTLSIGETASLIIAIAAMLATTYQAYLSRRHNRLQVEPYVLLEYSIVPRPSIDGVYYVSCKLHNSGLGPADIISVTFLLDDKEIKPKELMSALWDETGIDTLYQKNKINCEASGTQFSNGIYIKEDRTINLIDIKFWPQKCAVEVMQNELENSYSMLVDLVTRRLKIKVVYSSIYRGKNKIIKSDNYDQES